MSQRRRDFLQWVGRASLAGAAVTPLRLAAARPADAGPDGGHAPPVAETWDMSWTARVTGKYKAVFDSPEAADGAAMFRAVAWCEQYKEVYGAARSEMSPVIVLRHLGFNLAMNDEYWQIFDVGKRLRMRDDRGRKWAKVNPLGPAGAGAKDTMKQYSLEAFQQAGGIVLACGWSFGGAVSAVRERESLEAAAARERAKQLLMPGVILQPNGIFAALRAQEAGCSYVMAS